MAEQTTHGAARFLERRLAAAVAGKPSSLQAGEPAVEIGDDAKKGGPAFQRRVLIFPVIAGRMKPEARPVETSGDAASAQIGLGERAANGTGQAVKPVGGGGRIALGLFGRRLRDARHGHRLVQEGARLVERLAQMAVSLVEGDEIEKIAMFRGRGIRPFSASLAGELDEKAASRTALGVAAQPVTALAAAFRQIEAADGLRLARKPPREI